MLDGCKFKLVIRN